MLDRRQLLKLIPATLAASAVMRFLPSHAAERSPLGINLAGVPYWTSEHPFTNLATSASRWRLQPRDRPFTWDEPLPPMTEDGYPKSIPQDNYAESFLIATSHRGHLPRVLTVAYDGEGRMDYQYGAVLDQRGKGFDTIRLMNTDGPVTVRLFSTNADNPLHNLRVLEDPQNSESVFREPFLQRLNGMSVIRFMDWMATNNSPIKTWDERPLPGMFGLSEKGIPLEHMIELANAKQAAPWFTIPHLADDDYVRNFARQVREQLSPELPVYVEYSNEVWNSIFEQAAYAANEGERLQLSGNRFEAQLRFYSQRTSEVLAIFEQEFGEDKDRILGVYVAQGGNVWTSETVLDWGNARDHADVLAIAPYFGYSYGSPDRSAEVSTWSLDQLFEAMEAEVDGDNRQSMVDQANFAKARGLELAAYEAGQHLAGIGGAENDDRLTQLFIAANRDSRMGQLYKRYLQNWQDAGGGVMVLYNSMGEPTKSGSWGLLEDESGNVTPKWEAVHEFLNS
ncbi:hypothetical protein [Aureimonas fodinaquatilis]|nr:hypothetical protein [Aureimonas fodinaquatilis]